MGRFFTILLFFIFAGASNAYAQLNIRLNNNPPPSCSNSMRTIIFPKALSANAVCRPEVYKSKSRRVRYALQRINRWKKYAQKKWDQEHNDIYEKPTGIMKAPLYPSFSYDRAVIYMYEEWADECGRFNGKLADALIELSHLNSQCKDTLAYESMQRMWRDNSQVEAIYRNHGNPDSKKDSYYRGVASQADLLRNY